MVADIYLTQCLYVLLCIQKQGRLHHERISVLCYSGSWNHRRWVLGDSDMTTVHIIKTTHNGSPLGPRYEILLDGEYYEVGRRALQALQDGMTPEDLELEPFDEEEEDDVSFDDHRGDRWWHWGRV